MKLEAILQKLGLLQPGKIMYIGGSDVLPDSVPALHAAVQREYDKVTGALAQLTA